MNYRDLPDDLQYLILSFVYFCCNNSKKCKRLTNTVCIYCRKPVCSYHYHFINGGMCENCVETKLY